MNRNLGVAFQLGGILELELVSQIQMDLINQIYGPYFDYLIKASLTLELYKAFQAPQPNAPLDAIFTGASQSFQIFYAPASWIEGDAFNGISYNNEVYLIGPDQIGAATNYISTLSIPKNLGQVFQQLQGLVNFLKSVPNLYAKATQPPDYIGNSCLVGNSPPCIQLFYTNGFRSVVSPSGINLPGAVIVIVVNRTTGVWSTGIFEFIPA